MHHRVHASTHLVAASDKLRDTLDQFNHFTAENVATLKLTGLANIFLTNLAALNNEMTEAVAMLGDQASDLDVVRRLVSQPKLATPEVPQPDSLLRRVRQTQHYLTRFIVEETNEKEGPLMDIIESLGSAWEFIDLAEWHVIDAIREEKYNDPAFAEASAT